MSTPTPAPRDSLIGRACTTTLEPVASPISSDGVRAVAKSAVRIGATATSRWRSHPDLVIVGVKRGGTTSLFRDLEGHPGMCPLVPSARRLPMRENQKGVHFFDTGFDHGERWYRGHFPTTLTRRLRERRVGESFTVEASPYYFFHPLAAGRVAAALPEAHFAVLLRDPVERTVSHWSEQTRNGVETLALADAIDAEQSRVGNDGARLADGSLTTSHAHEQQTYVAQSMYAESLRRWFDAVGRDRITVAFSEDYYGDPPNVIRQITDRLGVTPMADDAIGRRRNAAPRTSDVDRELEARLVERFRSDVVAVGELLGRRPPWPRFASTTSG